MISSLRISNRDDVDEPLEADKKHQSPCNWENAVDPAHLDPHQGDRGFISHFSGQQPAVVQEHALKKKDKKLTDEIDNPAGSRLESVHDHFESDVPVAIGCDYSSRKG